MAPAAISSPPATARAVRSRLLLPWLLLAAVCGLSFFWRLGANGLWDLDEALYTESAREMRLSGDYVTPRVNAEPFFEKPPLIYWEAAALFTVLGRSELAARLPSALASTALTAILFLVGTRYFGRRAGFAAALFFALSPLVFGASRQLTTDATLDLCVASALLCLFAILERRPQIPNTQHPTQFPLFFWVCCALGVLAKGLPGILIPGLVGLLYMGFSERWRWREMLRAVGRLRPAFGVIVFAAIAVPWHVLAWIQSGEAFVHEYVVVQHLARFRGGDTAHKAPFWFFVPGLLAGFFPLSVYLPAALLARSRPREGEATHEPADRLRLLLKVWAVTVFVMFSASGSKLISYILPMYPAAALLVGDWCSRAIAGELGLRSLRRGSLLLVGLAASILCVLFFRGPIIAFAESLSHRPVRLDDVPPGAFEWADHIFGALTVATVCFAILLHLRRPKAAFGALAAGMALFFGIAVFEGLPLLNDSLVAPLQDAAAMAGRRALELRAPLSLYIGPPRRPSALFYLPDALVKPPGVAELMDPKDSHANIDAWLATNPLAVIVTDSDRAAYLVEHSGGRVLLERGKWTVLERDNRPRN
jgi:4-amino-4-deoxy-L-arabinose transferase-like glycosyltransferase